MKHADAHLICRRHAQSVNVSTHQAGALPEVPLTDLGRHQAEVAARSVAGAGITAIYASTAVRAEQTAGIIGGDLAARVADGETGHQVQDRVRSTLKRIGLDHGNQPVLIIGHVASLTADMSVPGHVVAAVDRHKRFGHAF